MQKKLNILREDIWGADRRDKFMPHKDADSNRATQNNAHDELCSSHDDTEQFVHRAAGKKLVNKDGMKYLPPGAQPLTANLIETWNIKDKDFFHIFYENKKLLLHAFIKDSIKGGMDKQLATQHANQTELIWGSLDNLCTMFPRNVLTNKYAIQDKYHAPSVRNIGKGGVEASTLRSRYTSLKIFISFLRKRGIFAGLFREDLTRIQENVADLNKELGPRIS